MEMLKQVFVAVENRMVILLNCWNQNKKNITFLLI